MSEREYSKTRRGKGGDRPCLGAQVESSVPPGTSHKPVDTLQRPLGNSTTCKAFTRGWESGCYARAPNGARWDNGEKPGLGQEQGMGRKKRWLEGATGNEGWLSAEAG